MAYILLIRNKRKRGRKMMGFDMKFGFGICICNKKEKSWVSDKVWICIYKEIKGNKAEK